MVHQGDDQQIWDDAALVINDAVAHDIPATLLADEVHIILHVLDSLARRYALLFLAGLIEPPAWVYENTSRFTNLIAFLQQKFIEGTPDVIITSQDAELIAKFSWLFTTTTREFIDYEIDESILEAGSNDEN